MKVAVTAQGKDMNSPVDPRFGRARYFIVVDTETGDFTAHDNAQNVNSVQGAGIQAAKNISDLGAGALISGNVGPNAFTALQAAGIDVYVNAGGTVAEAVEAFKAGKLEKTGKANVQGHWM